MSKDALYRGLFALALVALVVLGIVYTAEPFE